jgi:predicted AlkP superfamily phosphohydrolase/phosphomutase
VDQVIPSRQAVHGPYARRGPDLHVVFDRYRTIAFPLFATDNRVITRQIRGDSGCHRKHGIFIAWGSGIKAHAGAPGQATPSSAHIMDLAPTILHLMGLPVPGEMDGRVLTDVLSTSRPVKRAAASRDPQGDDAELSAEETAEVEDRLRALGYLG